MLAPVSLLGQTGLITALVLVNAVAWTAAILLAVRLATSSWQRQHLLLYLVPSMVISVFAWSNFHLGQPSLLLLALMLGGLAALQCKREVLGGALFAFAASIKAFPFVVIIYLLYRRYWVAAASARAAAGISARALADAVSWFQRKPARTSNAGRRGCFLNTTKKAWRSVRRSNSWRNQSIFGVANRMLRHVDADEQFKRHTPIYANFAELSFQAVTGVIVGIGLLLGLSCILELPQRDRRTPATDAIEFALFILLLLMFTPLSFGYLFACLLYPYTVIVQRMLIAPNRRLLICAAAAAFLLTLAIPMQKLAQTYGNYFFAALLLFIALALELWEQKRATASA